MAKIDTSKIEGYADMTAEEKLAALEGYDIPEPDMKGFVTKAQFDKTASELASWKKKHNALAAQGENVQNAQNEEIETLKQTVAALQKNEKINAQTVQLTALGYDAELAKATATAMVDGDFSTVLLNQQKFITEHDKSYKAQLMGGTPKPVGGTVGGSAIDYTKLIADANARGDITAVAYYTRLQEQNKTN